MQRFRSKRILVTLGLVAAGLGAGLTVASPARPASPQHAAFPLPAAELGSQTRAADLVFEGVVEEIRGRVSDAFGPDDVRLPHTYVTFRVERVFKGALDTPDGRFTLRLLGGENDEGLILAPPHAPRFAVGSREVLLIQNHGEWALPFVHGAQRRFRLEGEAVYLGGASRALRVSETGAIVLPEAPATEEEGGRAELHDLPSLRPDALRRHVSDVIAANHSPLELANASVTRSLELDEVLVVAAPRPVAVAAVQEPIAPPLPSADPDELEEWLLHVNDGNPVLPR